MSDDKTLELKVIFAAVDKFVRPVKAITQGASEASKALKATNDRLKDLNRTAAQIDAFKKAERDAAITANAFKATQDRIAALKAEMAAVATPTKAMAAEMDKAARAADDLKKKHEGLIGTQQKLFGELKAAGIDTRKLAEHRMTLSEQTLKASHASRQLSAALELENQKMKRLHAARAQMDKTLAVRDKMASVGAGIMAGGAAIGLPAAMATKTFADFETAMLGVARQVDGARDANGKLTKSYYEIGEAAKAMSERPALGKTANEIAKIVEAGARMGIQGKENLLIYAETTAVMASAFDLPVDKVGEDIGKISQLYKVPIKDIKQLGDTINWLDDNALAKGGDIIEVMKRIAGTADMVKMNFREAAALGSTFLSLGATSEIAATASNAMIRELSIATMQTKRFKGGLEMLKMDAKAIQFGMNKDATGTIIRVLEAIKRLPEEKQLEAATRLFGKEYGDDAAKLASNLDEYRRQLKLVNDEKARGSMQREADARGDTINARMAASKNAFTNLASDLGEHLKPALVETMEKTLSIIQAMRAWAKENPQLAAGIMSVVKGLAIGLTVIGGLTLAAAAVLGPIAAIKFGFTAIGLTGGTVAAKVLAIVSPIAKLTAALGAGYAIGTLFNAGLNRQISALLGYETTLGGSLFDLVEWIKVKFAELPGWFDSVLAKVKGFFASAFEEIRTAFNGGLVGILALIANWSPVGMFYQAMAAVLSYFGIELPGKFTEFGANLMSGLVSGIMNGIRAAKEAIGNAGDSVISFFKDKLGIHSPSKVFEELGGFTMLGLEQGLLGGADGPLGAVGALAKKLAGIGAGVAIGGAAMAGDLALDTRPPISPAAMLGAMAGGNTYNITINAAPGANNQDLAALVAREIERIEGRRAAQRRSQLRDQE